MSGDGPGATGPTAGSTGAGRDSRYRWLRELGRGATAVVELVHDSLRDAPVALKRMYDLTPETRFRIKQEFRRAREVRHPNLARLYDLFADESDTFFTMEAIDGTDLKTFIDASAADRTTWSGPALAVLADALHQLVDGVAALHAAGVVHRDLKPSNILVDARGRVVLLDFGFSSPLGGDRLDAEDQSMVGTLSFMAPERLWGGAPTAESDWYSVGVIAAELLTGRLPFSGSLQALLRAKDRPPESLLGPARGVPPDLDRLVCQLLRREPGQRPTAARIREVLEQLGPAPRGAGLPLSSAVFVGRDEELRRLEQWLAPASRAQLARVSGPSGIGKSALLRELAQRASARPGWVVFSGRCHPKEFLPLKALDAVMDEVSRYLRVLAPGTRARLRSLPGLSALTEIFPVLRRVPGLEAEDASVEIADSQARWVEAVRGFRALWSLLAENERVVVWIDDLQWSDRDGFKLLEDAITVEPRPPVAWILSHRRDGSSADPASLALTRLARQVPDDVLEIELGGLPAADATELATRLGASPALAGAIVRDAGGSPYLLRELARHAVEQNQPTLASADEIFDQRLSALSADERNILDHLALAAAPLPVEALTAIVGDAGRVQRTLERLETEALVRVSYRGDDGEQVVDLWHDRIGEGIAARVASGVQRERHLRLAAVLEPRAGTSRASVAFHYRRAGDVAKGVALTVEAAEECTRALAFGEAANLYQAALELDPGRDPLGLTERLAEALAHAGRCAEAGERFSAAAAAAERDPAGGARALELRMRAGAEFLNAGRMNEGRSALDQVLRVHRLRRPRWPSLDGIFGRVRALMRLRDPARASAVPDRPNDAPHRFDALWAAAKGTVMVEHVAGDALAVRSLLEAMRIGDPRRLCWALGHEAVSQTNIGGAKMHQRATSLLEQTARLAARTDHPYDRAWVHQCRGAAACFQGRWADAEAECRAALALYRKHCKGVTYETNVTAAFLLFALEARGRIREIATLLPELRTRADQTGDLFSSVVFRCGVTAMVPLAEDDAARAIRVADEALASWPLRNFTSQHFQHFLATLSARLYAGQTEEAWAQVERTWPDLGRAYFLRLDAIGILLRHLRARAALLAAAHVPDPSRQESFLAIAAREAAAIGRSTLPHAAPWRAALEMALALRRGRQDEAAARCQEALDAFARADMPLYREIARLRLGELAPSPDQRRRHTGESRDWLESAGVRNPAAMARLLVPLASPAPSALA